jgi:hypothetical protein
MGLSNFSPFRSIFAYSSAFLSISLKLRFVVIKMAADKVFHSRSEGIPSEGVKDQYADGKAARVWKKFIGDSNQRTQNYKNFLIGLLKSHGCESVLDIACGTG